MAIDLSAFEHTDYICYSFSSKEQTSFNFMTAVTVQSDFGGQKIKSATVSTFSLPINHEVMGLDVRSASARSYVSVIYHAHQDD